MQHAEGLNLGGSQLYGGWRGRLDFRGRYGRRGRLNCTPVRRIRAEMRGDRVEARIIGSSHASDPNGPGAPGDFHSMGHPSWACLEPHGGTPALPLFGMPDRRIAAPFHLELDAIVRRELFHFAG